MQTSQEALELGSKTSKENHDLNAQGVMLTFHSGQRRQRSSNHYKWCVWLASSSHGSTIFAKGRTC